MTTLRAYASRTGRQSLANLNVYLAYNFFRLAAILQGILGRVRDGTAANAEATAMAQNVSAPCPHRLGLRQKGRRMKIGLALGGGAARGLAHIPMLEVFDELGIKPAIIAGTSIGSVMGAGYAAGMSARDIRDHAELLLSSRADAFRHVFRNRKAKISELVSLKGFGSLRIKGETLADVALPDHLPKNIEDLPIPFKAIATDYDLQEERVIASGNLVQAVAASIAIPGIIEGPKIDGHIFVDGGVVNPVPFDHVRAGTDITVAIDVTGRPSALRRPNHSNLEVAVGSLLIMFHQIADLRHAANPPDIYIEPPLDAFNAMDFFKPREMWKACEPAKDKLKRALDLRIRGMD